MANERTTRGAFLRELRMRANIDVRSLAKQVGVSHTPIFLSESRIGHLSLDKALACAAACGATAAELDRVRVLDALDRGALPIPEGSTEQDVCNAFGMLELAANGRKKLEHRRTT